RAGNMMLIRPRDVEIAMEGLQCCQARAECGRAVIAALQRDKVLFLRCPERVVVVSDVTDGGVHRVRAAQREVDVPQRGGRELYQAGGETDRGFRSKMEITRRIGQSHHLLGSDANDALLPVADVD